MEEYEKYIGYYDWEGMPCEVRRSSSPDAMLEAQAYVPGTGFVPVDVADVVYNGHSISKDAFKENIMGLVALRREYPPAAEEAGY